MGTALKNQWLRLQHQIVPGPDRYCFVSFCHVFLLYFSVHILIFIRPYCYFSFRPAQAHGSNVLFFCQLDIS